jgi:hypothetical protein
MFLRCPKAQVPLQDFPKGHLHVETNVISSGGWSGIVASGSLNGQHVAFKFAFTGSERAKVSWSCVKNSCVLILNMALLDLTWC